MTGVFIRRRDDPERHTGTEEGNVKIKVGGVWSYASSIQGTHWKLKEAGRDSSLEPSKEARLL